MFRWALNAVDIFTSCNILK